MSLLDPLQWVFTGMVILVILLIVAGVGLRFFRALVGQMPPEGKGEKAGETTDQPGRTDIAPRGRRLDLP